MSPPATMVVLPLEGVRYCRSRKYNKTDALRNPMALAILLKKNNSHYTKASSLDFVKDIFMF